MGILKATRGVIAYICIRCTNTMAKMTTTAFLNRNSHDSFILSDSARSFGSFILSNSACSFGGFILTVKFLDSYKTLVCHINPPLGIPFFIRIQIHALISMGQSPWDDQDPKPSMGHLISNFLSQMGHYLHTFLSCSVVHSS